MTTPKDLKDWLMLARKAKSQTGKSVRSQIREVIQLRRQVQLGVQDYYFYRLFDDSRFTPDLKMQYTNWRFQEAVYRFVNDPSLITRTDLTGGWGGKVDKLLYHYIMISAGIRVPRVLGVYDPSNPFCGPIPVWTTSDQVAQFIESRGSEPFFLKPAMAHTGHGAMAVDKVEGRRVFLSNGSVIELHSLLVEVTGLDRVIFQERLRPHPVLEKKIGRTIATVRAVVLVRPASSEIHRTIFRIPVGKNMVDNFEGGRTGNLIGWVNPKTGEVERVFQGVGLEQVQLTHHPGTGELLQGLKLPDWKEGLDLVLAASRVLSGMAFQSWDLAFTSQGPVLDEVNDMSSQDILQLAGPPGMLDKNLCRFLQERGFPWTYPRLH